MDSSRKHSPLVFCIWVARTASERQSRMSGLLRWKQKSEVPDKYLYTNRYDKVALLSFFCQCFNVHVVVTKPLNKMTKVCLFLNYQQSGLRSETLAQIDLSKFTSFKHSFYIPHFHHCFYSHFTHETKNDFVSFTFPHRMYFFAKFSHVKLSEKPTGLHRDEAETA